MQKKVFTAMAVVGLLLASREGVGPAVVAVVSTEDRVAVDIIDAGGRALGAQVAAVARRLWLAAPVAVAGAGGVFAEMDRLRAPMAEGAARVAVQLGPPQLPAHLGALLLSLREAGVSLPDAALSRWALPYEA